MVLVVAWLEVYFFFFFFKQKTAYEIVDCDWSSDVCSSDLETLILMSYMTSESEFPLDQAIDFEPFTVKADESLDRKSVV